MNKSTLPLGKNTAYPSEYDPDVLFAIPRADNRVRFSGAPLPFHGIDLWNAWELTWLANGGLPQVATAEIRVPADSINLIESKSLKLYLNSYAMTRFDDASDVARSIARDLSRCADGDVSVDVQGLSTNDQSHTSTFAGTCLDQLDISCDTYDADATLLRASSNDVIQESVYSHLLRSLCPVTAQPDIGSIGIRYRGPQIDHKGLLRYIVSYREHNDFHEACVESIFADILAQCEPTDLTVYARFQRRGGLDINPFRSNFEDNVDNIRLYRQ